MNLQTAAKMLGRGPNKMAVLLRDMGILYYTRGGINVPAQRHITAGHFVVKSFKPAPTPELRLQNETQNLLSRNTPGGGDTPPVPPSQDRRLGPPLSIWRTQFFTKIPGGCSIGTRFEAYPMDNRSRRPQSTIHPQ